MTGRFVIKRSDGQLMFNLKASGNSEIVLTSERYTRKASLLDGLSAVRLNAKLDARYQRKVAQNGQAYFVLRANNDEIVGTSELYSSAAARDGGIEVVKNTAPSAEVDDQT